MSFLSLKLLVVYTAAPIETQRLYYPKQLIFLLGQMNEYNIEKYAFYFIRSLITTFYFCKSSETSSSSEQIGKRWTFRWWKPVKYSYLSKFAYFLIVRENLFQ